MDKGQNSILGAKSCEEYIGKLLWFGHAFHTPAIDQQTEYMPFNMMMWSGVMQALKRAMVPVYPGGQQSM